MVRGAARHHAGAMTTTPPTDPPADAPDGGGTATDEAGPDRRSDQGPRVSAEEVRDLGRLRRTTTDRKVAGVAGGLARHLDVDPIILRVAFVVLAFFGGAGLILYAAGWLLLPEEGEDRATLHLDERSRTIALLALTVLAGLALVGDSWGAGWFPWPLAIIGLIAFVWLSRSRERDARRATAPTVPGDPAYAGPAPYTAYAPPTPRDPRKRGPKLFWFTLLLILVAEGVLAIADGVGLSVVDSAYPALAVGLVALMLVVGSVVGRAGGLIALGLLASVFLAGATAADRWDGERYTYEPTTADEVQDSYSMRTGELVLDLTEVDDLEDLDGRTVDVTGDVGRIEVLVPADLTTSVNGRVDGPGSLSIFGQDSGGIDIGASAESYGGPGAPELTIDADLSVGQITVETE
jgi:phage shock protein PspC (stress-responsive transcriptional regulator)